MAYGFRPISSVRAIILGSKPYGESNCVLEMLSEDEGIVRAFAPAARKSSRRFGGVLEPGTLVNALFMKAPGRDTARLQEASMNRGLSGKLRSDLGAILRAGWMLDLVRSLFVDAQPHTNAFHLLDAGIEALDNGRMPLWGMAAFELGALTAYGAGPRFDGCCCCGRPPQSCKSRFSPVSGGLLCPSCSPGWGRGDIVLKADTISAMKILAGIEPGRTLIELAGTLPDDPEAVEEACTALSESTVNLLGRPLKSRKMIEEMMDFSCPQAAVAS